MKSKRQRIIEVSQKVIVDGGLAAWAIILLAATLGAIIGVWILGIWK